MRRLTPALGLTLLAVAATAPSSAASVPASTAAGSCTKSHARSIVNHSAFPRHVRRTMKGFFGGGPVQKRPVATWYDVGQVICSDLTGDGRSDLAVLLRCCTVSTPSPWAIYIRQGRSWRLSYERIGYKTQDLDGGTLAAYTVFHFGLSQAPLGILDESPWYGPQDANCCPSQFVNRVVHWDGARFTTDVGPLTPID